MAELGAFLGIDASEPEPRERVQAHAHVSGTLAELAAGMKRKISETFGESLKSEKPAHDVRGGTACA